MQKFLSAKNSGVANKRPALIGTINEHKTNSDALRPSFVANKAPVLRIISREAQVSHTNMPVP